MLWKSLNLVTRRIELNVDCSMENCLSHASPHFSFSPLLPKRRQSMTVASGGSRSRRRSKYSGAPLEPSTTAGEFLLGALLDGCDGFQVVARKELELLAAARDGAVARFHLTRGSQEACLHRRIAELKSIECQKAVEDIMYILALHKFSEIRVHLIPSLFRCIYNGRLEILPSMDWELESIYSFEVLEIVRGHINAVVGLKANSNVTDSWAITEITRGCLCKLYASSFLFGYFLKSAFLRYRLEWGLDFVVSDQIPILGTYPLGISKNTAFGCVTSPRFVSVGQLSRKEASLRSYVMGFHPEAIQICAKPKSKEAVDLIKRHNCALFGHEETGLVETDEVIRTSFASVKRFVLEAVAFGYFLWDIESSVNAVYTLEENREA